MELAKLGTDVGTELYRHLIKKWCGQKCLQNYFAFKSNQRQHKVLSWFSFWHPCPRRWWIWLKIFPLVAICIIDVTQPNKKKKNLWTLQQTLNQTAWIFSLFLTFKHFKTVHQTDWVYLGVESHISVTVCTWNMTQNNSGGAVKWGWDKTQGKDVEIFMSLLQRHLRRRKENTNAFKTHQKMRW